MPTRRPPMRRVREILRLHHEREAGCKCIARSCNVGKNTVLRCLQRARGRSELAAAVAVQRDTSSGLERDVDFTDFTLPTHYTGDLKTFPLTECIEQCLILVHDLFSIACDRSKTRPLPHRYATNQKKRPGGRFTAA